MKIGDIEERFWSHVDRRGPDECWNWTGSFSKYGKVKSYGRLCRRGAHIISWEIHSGPVPNRLYVLHTCDNRACVNPHHLYLGTKKDNTQEALIKGRLFGNKYEMILGESLESRRKRLDNERILIKKLESLNILLEDSSRN